MRSCKCASAASLKHIKASVVMQNSPRSLRISHTNLAKGAICRRMWCVDCRYLISCKALRACCHFLRIAGLVICFRGALTAAVGGCGLIKMGVGAHPTSLCMSGTDEGTGHASRSKPSSTGKSSVSPSSKDWFRDGPGVIGKRVLN